MVVSFFFIVFTQISEIYAQHDCGLLLPYCIGSTHAHVVLGRIVLGNSMGRKNAATALDCFDKACNIGPLKFVWSAQALTSQPGLAFAA